MTLHAFVISWTGRHANSLAIAAALRPAVDQLTLIYSDRDESLDLATQADDSCAPTNGPPTEFLKTPNAWYLGKKFPVCLERFRSDVFLLVCGDTSCRDWAGLAQQCRYILSSRPEVALWCPEIDYTYHTLQRTRIASIPGTTLSAVVETDAIVVAMTAPIGDRLRQLNYDADTYGWGISTAACAVASSLGKVAVLDQAVSVQHPRSRGYEDRDCKRMAEAFLDQLSATEKVHRRLLLSHREYLRATGPIGFLYPVRRIMQRLLDRVTPSC